MIYDSPLWAFEEEVITDVSNFKEEGLVTPEGGEGEKVTLKIDLSIQEIEPRLPSWRKEYWSLQQLVVSMWWSKLEQSVL